MRTLLQSLQDQDRGQLSIIAELWGLELRSGSTGRAAASLANGMLRADAANELVSSLSANALDALVAIQHYGGRMPMAEALRRFGPLREMGPGRRDREKPWRDPVSPLEALWYRGLIARAFADSPKGALEFAFIPSDMLSRLPAPPQGAIEEPGAPASYPPGQTTEGATAVDDAATVVAALRVRPSQSSSLAPARRSALAEFMLSPGALRLLIEILLAEGILDLSPCAPNPTATREFLDQPREHAQARLLRAWLHSEGWNDLALLAHLSTPDGTWPNHPRASREAAVALTARVPPGQWWSLDAFLQYVKQEVPDFLRPASEFDSWYLRDVERGVFLQGFEAWDAVEGAYLRSLIRGPLHWLGVVELGGDGSDLAFRLTPWIGLLTGRSEPAVAAEAHRPVKLRADGNIHVPRQTRRTYRYQISRFSAWLSLSSNGTYLYRLTAGALSAAAGQELKPAHILSILEEASEDKVPRNLRQAIQRWARAGSEAQLVRQIILRVADPKLIVELRSNPATARLLGEVLASDKVLIAESNWEPLYHAALRAGLLIGRPETDHTSSP